jgi:hypothetical protein
MLSQLHLIRDYDARNMLDPSRVEMNELDEDLLQNLQQLGYVDE